MSLAGAPIKLLLARDLNATEGVDRHLHRTAADPEKG
jgi:hypothetical protein